MARGAGSEGQDADCICCSSRNRVGSPATVGASTRRFRGDSMGWESSGIPILVLMDGDGLAHCTSSKLCRPVRTICVRSCFAFLGRGVPGASAGSCRSRQQRTLRLSTYPPQGCRSGAADWGPGRHRKSCLSFLAGRARPVAVCCFGDLHAPIRRFHVEAIDPIADVRLREPWRREPAGSAAYPALPRTRSRSHTAFWRIAIQVC
jgi:hypothetical protein